MTTDVVGSPDTGPVENFSKTSAVAGSPTHASPLWSDERRQSAAVADPRRGTTAATIGRVRARRRRPAPRPAGVPGPPQRARSRGRAGGVADPLSAGTADSPPLGMVAGA